MANRTARMESIGSALLVGGEVEWEMKTKKGRQASIQACRLSPHYLYGYWPRRVEKNDTIPFNCIFSDQMFRLSDILLFDIGLFFFLSSFFS